VPSLQDQPVQQSDVRVVNPQIGDLQFSGEPPPSPVSLATSHWFSIAACRPFDACCSQVPAASAKAENKDPNPEVIPPEIDPVDDDPIKNLALTGKLQDGAAPRDFHKTINTPRVHIPSRLLSTPVPQHVVDVVILRSFEILKRDIVRSQMPRPENDPLPEMEELQALRKKLEAHREV